MRVLSRSGTRNGSRLSGQSSLANISAALQQQQRVTKTIVMQTKPKQQKVVARDPSADMDVYQDEYFRLNQEIALLHCELRPLREKAEQLRRSILIAGGAFSEDMIVGEPPEKFASAKIELENEKDALKHKLSSVRTYVRPGSMDSLVKEIGEGSEVCALFAASLADLGEQTNDLRTRARRFRQSTLYDDIQEQRKRIEQVSTYCNDAKQQHLALKAEMYQMLDPALQQEERVQNEADRVIKMKRRLDQIWRKHAERTEFYVTLREQQMKEMQLVNGAMIRKTESVWGGFPGLLNQPIPALPRLDLAEIPEDDYGTDVPDLPSGVVVVDADMDEGVSPPGEQGGL